MKTQKSKHTKELQHGMPSGKQHLSYVYHSSVVISASSFRSVNHILIWKREFKIILGLVTIKFIN